MANPPKTLDQLRAMEPGSDRVKAIGQYIEAGEEKIRAARRLRDDDVRDLAGQVGPTKAAAACELGIHTVKAISRGRS